MQHNVSKRFRSSANSSVNENPEKQWLSENEEKELAQKHNIQLKEETRDSIGREVQSFNTTEASSSENTPFFPVLE